MLSPPNPLFQCLISVKLPGSPLRKFSHPNCCCCSLISTKAHYAFFWFSATPTHTSLSFHTLMYCQGNIVNQEIIYKSLNTLYYSPHWNYNGFIHLHLLHQHSLRLFEAFTHYHGPILWSVIHPQPIWTIFRSAALSFTGKSPFLLPKAKLAEE